MTSIRFGSQTPYYDWMNDHERELFNVRNYIVNNLKKSEENKGEIDLL